MSKLLQIDSCLGILSTGKITESIASLAREYGWETYIAHGARCIGATKQTHFQITTKFDEYIHYGHSLIFDTHGLHSTAATKRLVRWIDEINPDIIHLHCIHGYYLNYEVLFEYLNTHDIPVVWTFHDCWAFTGHCAHFVTADCLKWKTECNRCPLKRRYPQALIDNSTQNYKLKKSLFSANQNLHIVAVSKWLESFIKESFLRDKDICVINNGVDTSIFTQCCPKNEKFTIMGVASVWTESKGLYDFYQLRKKLETDKYDIILVGLSQKQISELPSGIIGISRTANVHELAKLYSSASIFVNPTYADSFPTVNMEALACGTPVITYATGGSPEIIDSATGIVVPQGDIVKLVDAIQKMKKSPFSAKACRSRAESNYDKDKCFEKYIKLYMKLLKDVQKRS